MTVRTVNCPHCGAHVSWNPASRFRPFCSERCKMMDLGAWATEKYRVAKAEDEPDTGSESRQEEGMDR